jgi:membrane protein implicated in regulation of membrane protease activity
MNENIQLFGACFTIGMHIFFALLGLILLAFKQVQTGFAFLCSGTTAPFVVGLAIIGLVPNFWAFLFWLFIWLGILYVVQNHLENKWKPKKQDEKAAA